MSLAQQSLSVAKLVEFVKSSVAQKLPDKEVAGYLAAVQMNQKLNDQTVEDLQTAGAGPKTVAALNRLVEQSTHLAEPAPPAPPKPKPQGPPPPPVEEQRKVLDEVRDYALNYTKSLPDFICLQLTHRFVDMHYQPGSEGSWSPSDRIAEKLSYFEQHEKYEAISHNDNAMIGKDWESLGGSISRGEFGTLLREIFEPESNADIRWLRWGTFDGHLSHVYEYRIDREHSRETIEFEKKQQVTPAYHGLVYVQKDENVVLGVTVEPDIPADFPVQDVHQVVIYHYVDISGRKFLLPAVSRVQMRNGRYASKNDIEFRGYKKYSADTSITFDDAEDTTPDSKTPATPTATPQPPKQ
jgi:hypothetical protein